MRVVPREHKISRPGTVVKKLFRDFLFEKAIRDRREREEKQDMEFMTGVKKKKKTSP